MKFACEKSTLLDAINIASRAVSGKSAIALLEGLLIEANADLSLTGYDLSLGIRTSIAADILETGSIVLNAKLFGDIIRKLPDDTIYLETNEKLMTTIKCGRSVFNLIASSADDFPQIPNVTQTNHIKLTEATLKNMISKTIFAVSDNESKPIHTGCLFEASEKNLNVIAIDGYRMAVRRENLAEMLSEELKFVVPGFALREIERILSDKEEIVTIYPDEKHILFSIENTMLITRLIDGEFLNYRSAIPTDSDYTVQIHVKDLITCIERVSLIISEKLKNPIRLHFEGNMLQMSCITAIGKSYDECQYEGAIENLEIGFNNRYLLEALRACSNEEQVTISLKGALNPMVITPNQTEEFTYLVLPVRLKANE